MEEAPRQRDMFEEEYDKPRVFRCIGGAYIGTFNRNAAAASAPIVRLSAFFSSDAAADTALQAAFWPPPEPEDCA